MSMIELSMLLVNLNDQLEGTRRMVGFNQDSMSVIESITVERFFSWHHNAGCGYVY